MPSAESTQDAGAAVQDAPMQETSPAGDSGTKKRPRLDLHAEPRKRGKSMFGLVLGTLNKAKIEDKERNASEAAKKRQLIEQRLQTKLRKETDSVRRAEEAKKDKTTANRKEEDLQLKDSLHKLRRTRLPLLANFLLTSDHIPSDNASPLPPTANPLSLAPRTHPPPLYYLPAILTPAQESFINRRKADVKDAAEKEWEEFRTERTAGIEEISQLRQRVAEEEARKKADREAQSAAAAVDKEMTSEETPAAGESNKTSEPETREPEPSHEAEMEVDESPAEKEPPREVAERKDEPPAPPQADEDDALEY
ncbi:hypothetical protein PLICRDRAFT_34307 [Plicaturopsis crispa FD-325 SS-3]|nr:hypothetical protein PLICRDRAFT_34307 [Plicaturopsis crispa FD-325 SS-3]